MIVGQYVNARGVGVYVRGERGDKPDEVEQRPRPYAARLKKAVGARDFVYNATPRKYFFLKFKSCNSSSAANWGKMADWLHKEADAYQKTLHRVMEGPKKYRWASPHEWLLEQIEKWPEDMLVSTARDLALVTDADTIQQLFHSEMDADGYFKPLGQNEEGEI